ncbi:MAG: glycosyltransferase [Candidatus Hadarchaeum sp.]
MEAHLLSLAKYLKLKGCEVEVITLQSLLAESGPLTVGGLQRAVSGLAERIKTYDPDVVHLHPFFSVIVGSLASSVEGRPYVVTVHGPGNLVLGYEEPYCFMFVTAVNSAARIFCVSEETADLVLSVTDDVVVKILRNPVDLDVFRPAETSRGGRVAVCGRLDREKIRGVRAFLESLAGCHYWGTKEVDIFGDGDGMDELREPLSVAEESGWKVRFMGWSDGLASALAEGYSVVAGMGRVMLEGMAMKLPCLLLGYDGIKGWIKPENVERYARRNFSGRYEANVDLADTLREEIVPNEIEREGLRLWVERNCDCRMVTDRYLDEIRKVQTRRSSDLEWLLWALEAAPEDLRSEPILDSTVFSRLLRRAPHPRMRSGWNMYRAEGGMPGVRSFVETVRGLDQGMADELEVLRVERDELRGKVASLEQTVNFHNAEIHNLKRELNRIYDSGFWRIARVYYAASQGPVMRKVHWLLKKAVTGLEEWARERQDRRQAEGILAALEGRDGGRLDKRVFLIYPIGWDHPLRSRPHHFAKGFANSGYLSAFVSPSRTAKVRRVAEGLYVVPHGNYLRCVKNSVILLASTDSQVPLHFLKEWKRSRNLVVYDYIDQISPEIGGDIGFVRERHSLLDPALVDLVLCVSKTLYSEMRERFPEGRVLYLPNACDYGHFSKDRKFARVPEKMREIVEQQKPIIGYYGSLAVWIDYELLNYISYRRRDWNIVLIGVDYDGSYKYMLSKRDNVHYLGPVDYSDLPDYAVWFDVALIPFKAGKIARATSPIKLYEYLALGKVAVYSEDLVECSEYETPLRYNGKEDAIEKIEKALVLRTDEDYIRKVKAEAAKNTWEVRVRELVEKIEELKREYSTCGAKFAE